jgi:3-hydroxyisobutyrate dehydrogenase-like beta-hydroxyacid dehydrogenase
MGYGMCANLRKKLPQSQTLYIYDVAPATSKRFVDEYAQYGPITLVNSAKDVAANTEVLLSIVPTVNNVREVYLDPQNGIIGAPKNEARLLLECSTIDVESARSIGYEVTKAGVGTYVDSPVSVSAARLNNRGQPI